MPNSITVTGIHDSGDTMRKNGNAGPAASSARRGKPSAKPMGMPAANAPIKPTATRCKLAPIYPHSAASGSRCAKLPNAAAGVSIFASGMDCAKIRLPICQNASSASKPVNPRICVRYFMVCVL